MNWIRCGERGGSAMNIRTYRELKVWQAAMDAAMEIFALTKAYPAEEDIRSSIRSGAHRGQVRLILRKRGGRGDMKRLLRAS